MKTPYNTSFFNVPSVLNSYWAGFIAADGCVRSDENTVQIYIDSKDALHLEQLANDVSYCGDVKQNCRKMSYIEFYGASEWVGDLYTNFNITSRKTTTLMPPKLQGDLAFAYIVGYIDGDGCIWTPKAPLADKIALSVRGTEQLLAWMSTQFVIDDVRPRKSKGCFQMAVSGRKARTVLQSLITLPMPKLQRKWIKYSMGAGVTPQDSRVLLKG